ncbi:MAG: hypothetical protein JEZ09_13715 [Salinivirgaceae bacterium]|nr:hypothetical protein [Salinivirgaceae bacterium]
MKTKTFKLKYRTKRWQLLGFVILLGASISTYGQTEQKPLKPLHPVKSVEKNERSSKDDETITGSEKTIYTSMDIDFRPKVSMVLYDTETEILPARNNSIEILMEYVAEGKNEADIQKLHKAIEENLIKKHGENIDISLKFYKSYSNMIIAPGISKVNMELNDNSKIKLTKFEISSLKIYLPADLDLKIEAKYSPVDIMFSMNGELEIDAYDSEIEGRSVRGKLDATCKYSKLRFASASDTKLNLYESKVWIEKVKKLTVDSKYSEINIDNMTSVVLSGYEDEIDFVNVPDAQFNVKYCEIELDESKTIDADMYEGSINLKQSDVVTFNGKYVECDFETINSLDMIDSYENEIDIKQINHISSMNGKYNKFHIDNVSKSVRISGYEDDIEIALLGADFERVVVDGKYMDLELIIPKKTNYKLHGLITYPDLHVDKSDYNVVIHDEGDSKLEFEYYRGKKENVTKEIKLNGYEIDATIDHQ